MEVNAVNQMTQLANQTEVAAVPDAADVDTFNRSLFGKGHQSPDEMATASIQEKSLVIDEAMDKARDTIEAINNPAVMRTVASGMSKHVLEVDLIAKMAGSIAQGINKLTSMQ